MKDFTARFVTPLASVRPRGGRLIEGFSPKLQRRVRVFSHASFTQWIRLEADPAVSAFCERPARLTREPGARLIDFWLESAKGEEMLLLEPDEPGVGPLQVDGIPVRAVSAAELAAARVWVANWSCMLPVINATRALLPQALLESVVRHVREPVPLVVLEEKLSFGEPSLARGAIFEQIRAGRIGALSLQTQPISLHTMLEPIA